MTYVPASLRQTVVERAGNRCEYCRYLQSASLLAFETVAILQINHPERVEERQQLISAGVYT